ncbi:MAG: GTPase HflX [Clostridia bacterium]|nr:GTPase HflX [Clostridia bacterium]
MKNNINGNTQGVKTSILERMLTMYDMRCQAYEFITPELVDSLVLYTELLGREISIYISRDGRVVDVSIGDGDRVSMPTMRLVRNIDRLSGVRCIHTHPSGDGRLSGVDLGTLRSVRLDSMAAIGVKDGRATSMYAAFIGDIKDNERLVVMAGPLRPYHLPDQSLMNEIIEADNRLKSSTMDVTEARPERCILVGIDSGSKYDSIEELAQLADTAGAVVVGRSVQKRRSIDNATYIGSGKADELLLMGSELEADIFIFDDELSAIQIRNLENELGTRVIDRTALILDIFASRAQSREGKLQVELAQLKYRLPRLLGQGQSLTRQGGGIGTRGPGEKKLEIDRRRIRRRIFELEQELCEIEKQRELRREARERNTTPLVALVGYTNAGKSTLLNALSDAGVLAEDKLFATLDPVVRRIELPEGGAALIADTVGFINKLPHELVSAFRSTLEEVSRADLILHIIDSTSEYRDTQMAVVEEVLMSLEASDTPRINVYNKADAIEVNISRPSDMKISALTGEGINELLFRVAECFNQRRMTLEILIPFDRFDIMGTIRKEATILEESYEENGCKLKLLIDRDAAWKIKKCIDK